MDIPITVRPDAPTPIYLQIKYQLAYLITSGTLREGHKLPTVRAVADHLGVNPGTVAQAYRELHGQGLVEASAGRGTFVAGTLPVEVDTADRQRLLDDALRRAILRARGLGFGDGDIRQHLELVLRAPDGASPVLFAAPSMAVARKYATSLERRLGSRLEVHPVTFEAIAARSPTVAALLDTAYFVVTFAGLARGVEHDLERFGAPCRVLGCATEVQPDTLQALAAVPRDARVCVVTQEMYLPQTLNLVATTTGREPSEVTVLLDGDAEGARRTLGAADRVVFTFLAREFVVEQGVPPERRLEVTFDLTVESVERIARLLFPDDAHAPAEGTGRPGPGAPVAA